jgi:hypothetical protein
MNKLVKKRKSSIDVDNASNVITGIIFVAILLAVLLLVVAIIFGLSIFQGVGSGGTNLSTNISNIQSQIMGMVINFFALMPTIGTILAVVILIAGILLLVFYVRRMKESGTGGAGFQG